MVTKWRRVTQLLALPIILAAITKHHSRKQPLQPLSYVRLGHIVKVNIPRLCLGIFTCLFYCLVNKTHGSLEMLGRFAFTLWTMICMIIWYFIMT